MDGLVRRRIFLDQVDHATSLSPEDRSEAPVEIVAIPRFAAIGWVVPTYLSRVSPPSF